MSPELAQPLDSLLPDWSLLEHVPERTFFSAPLRYVFQKAVPFSYPRNTFIKDLQTTTSRCNYQGRECPYVSAFVEGQEPKLGRLLAPSCKLPSVTDIRNFTFPLDKTN